MSNDNDEVGGDYTDDDEVDDEDDYGDVDAVEKGNAFSVRCVQDGSVAAEKQNNAKPTKRHIDDDAVYFTDSRDGRKYRVVDIGEQTWMAENLDYLPKTGNSWCYDNDKSNCAAYGRLYDWNTAMIVCPTGWHLPNNKEWDSLALEANGESSINNDGNTYWRGVGKRLKAKDGWNAWRSASGNGTDNYKFSALPGGHRAATKSGVFNNIGYYGYWWTATKVDKDHAYALTADYDNGNLSEDNGDIRYGFSVRCVQDETPEKAQKRIEEEQRKIAEEQRKLEEARKIKEEEEKRLEKLSTYFTDSRDGKKYRVVTIGGKKWLAENLNYAPPRADSWCYKNSADSCKKYGRLYDWNVARTVCPTGWHLPTREEWGELGQTVGGEKKTFDNGTIDWYGAGNTLKSKTGWDKSNGTDDYGFSALPGGNSVRNPSLSFRSVGELGYWWTASERKNPDEACWYRLGYNKESNSYYELVEYYDEKNCCGLSVRCVQNAK